MAEFCSVHGSRRVIKTMGVSLNENFSFMDLYYKPVQFWERDFGIPKFSRIESSVPFFISVEWWKELCRAFVDIYRPIRSKNGKAAI